VLAYGQTGTGKTYTTFGPDIDAARVTASDASSLGMIPRAIHELFERSVLLCVTCIPASPSRFSFMIIWGPEWKPAGMTLSSASAFRITRWGLLTRAVPCCVDFDSVVCVPAVP
jgi:hypothetical protein